MAAAQVSSSRAKLTGRAAVLLLVVAVLAVSYASSMRAWLKQRSDINTLNAQIADQRADVAALRESKQRLHDPAYIESVARKRFGWILPGEVGYRVIGDDGEVLSDGGSRLSDPAGPAAAPTPDSKSGTGVAKIRGFVVLVNNSNPGERAKDQSQASES